MALDKAGGLDALGGQKFDNMYHAGWAWAGDTPFHHTKPVRRTLAARAILITLICLLSYS